MVSLEDILRKGFSKGVRDLILGSYLEDLDKPVPYVFAKVMVTYVDVLGTRVKLWNPCEIQCTGIVFKNLAIYVGLGTDNLKILLASFLNQKHIGSMSRSDCNMAMYSASVVDKATCVCNLDAQMIGHPA
jgi:hypothetical protein